MQCQTETISRFEGIHKYTSKCKQLSYLNKWWFHKQIADGVITVS